MSGRAPAFFRCPSSRLGELALRHLAEGELDGRVAVALGVAHGGDRDTGPASITVTGTRVPSSVNTWVIPSFLPMIAAITQPSRS